MGWLGGVGVYPLNPSASILMFGIFVPLLLSVAYLGAHIENARTSTPAHTHTHTSTLPL